MIHDGFRLTYSMNVHPTGSAEEVLAALRDGAAPLAERLAPGRPFVLGLRLGAAACRELLWGGKPLRDLRDLTSSHRWIHATLNGFPHGEFHAARVKEQVYRPTWLEEERLHYTLDLARLLVALEVGEGPVTISTLAGSYRKWGHRPSVLREVAANLARAAEGLADIADATGLSVRLCLEPEPDTTLQTTPEVIAFFTEVLPECAAPELIERHLGVCFDTCHQAVLFEDLPASLRALRDANVPIGKVQIGNAMAVTSPAEAPEAVRALRRFDEPRYLHQVAGKDPSGGAPMQAPDLADVLGDRQAPIWSAEAWRVHFHVPLFASQLGPIGTTQADTAAALAEVGAWEAPPLLEIETYTWDVLPSEERAALDGGRLVDGLEKEFRWVLQHLPPPVHTPIRAPSDSEGAIPG